MSKNLNLPDFALLTIRDITSSAKEGRVGILPISRITWLKLIEHGFAPKGQQMIGRTLGWTVLQVREVAEKISRGELKHLKLWAKK